MNLGKSIHRYYSVKDNFRIKREHGKSMSPRKKLGLYILVKTIVLNPKLRKYSKQIKSITESGNIIGIHGGRNHKSWEMNIDKWDRDKIKKEILWSKKSLTKIISIEKIANFSSPAWQTNNLVIEVCEELGLINLHDSRFGKNIVRSYPGMRIHHTDLCEEKSGVGYIEFLLQQKLSKKEILKKIINEFETRQGQITLYDHPLVAGIIGLDLIEDIIDWCQQNHIIIEP
jgi:SOS response regulatory protein OraA/RecX